MHPFQRRGGSAAGARPVPLMVSLGVVSLVLTLALAVTIAGQIQRVAARRGVADLTSTTQSAIAITINTIVTGLTYGAGGIPTTTQQQQAQATLISSASQVLVANSAAIAVEAVLADGTVIGGSGTPPIGTKNQLDSGFTAAISGVTQVRTLHANATDLTPAEKEMLRQHGDLLLIEQGVRVTPTGPVLAVVSAFAPLEPTRHQAAVDTWKIVKWLALGLIGVWVVLFRLVFGASVRLTRQTRANVTLATHDFLTGLPNRELVRERTDQAIVASHRSGTHVALLLTDLDRFKEINDTLGHPYGDMLLKQIGPRLREHLRESDTVARLGGDEFVVLLPDVPHPEAALVVAEKLAVAIREPFVLNGVSVEVSSSTGLAMTPGDGVNFDELLQHADVAMYVAKEDNLGMVAYDPLLDLNTPARLSLLGDLRRAVEETEQILLYYQPQADLTTGQIVGVEALVRWQHPVHGLLAPDAFIPLAERTGIIRPLTWCILRKALEQNREWAKDGLLLRVSVNISARCLLEPGFAEGVTRLLRETAVPAERLEMELTETAMMVDPDRARGVLEDLAERRMLISIDDFGTGYSSLARLKRLPVTELKIDQTFITGMATDASDDAIVRSCIDLARNLHLTVVAEGVETLEVWEQLKSLGCATAQGYFLARPMPAAAVTRWMADHLVAITEGGS